MISFIAPAYNVSKYLDDFFQSFRGLNKDDFEIVFIDDCGQEPTKPFYMKYKKEFNITYVQNKKNKGLGFSRNEGLKHVSEETTHIIYIDTDDKVAAHDWMKDISPKKITWFNAIYFDKKDSWYKDRVKNFGHNLFPNTIWGVAIPINIAKEVLFETKSYEDLLVNRRLMHRYKNDIITSRKTVIAYRCRASGINNSKPTYVKYKDFMDNMVKLIDEGINSYRFNIQEIYQYYWMWRKYLKSDLKAKDLPRTKLIYKIAFCFTGGAIRFLHLEGIVYGRGRKNAFE